MTGDQPREPARSGTPRPDSSGTGWDPGQYLRFSDHRLRPALDLLGRIPLESPEIVVDLGCGTGRITRLLAGRWPEARIEGIDSSAEMLQKAREEPGGVRWLRADIAAWQPEESPDVLYSNAALHWLEGHRELFPRLTGLLRQGGCLAVQMPLSWDLPSHRLMRETLAEGRDGGRPLGSRELREKLAHKPVHDAEFYHDVLSGSVRVLDIWETEYHQMLEGEDPVLEWVRGTGLRPVLHALDDDERQLFLDAYGRRLRDAYPTRPDGITIYPFRRLFLVAVV